ncbi:MAG: lysophospholipase [Candidatus Hydrogenedentota bacterium]
MTGKGNDFQFPRRIVLQGAIAAGGAAILSGGAAHAAEGAEVTSISLKQNGVVLFQGDSITDAGRNKEQLGPNDLSAWGFGYAMMAASAILGAHARLTLQCYNRGISGNKVPDLAARWQAETIDLNPAVLSILIGVNDLWHKKSGKYDGTVEQYESGYAELLNQTKAALPDVILVVCEPFVLRCGAIDSSWFPEFDDRRAAAKRVADNVGAIWVPFQSMFDAAVSEATPPEYWAKDGVHPSVAGHALMARTWLETTGLG